MSGARRLLDPNERVAWLKLARTPGLGALGFSRLIARFGSASAVLAAAPDLARLSPPSKAAAEAELEGLDRLGARLIAACEPDYAALLAALDPAPPVLAVHGDVRRLHWPTIAIVGARDASAAGLLVAQTLARDLGQAGLTIVSGLARDIDTAADVLAALEAAPRLLRDPVARPSRFGGPAPPPGPSSLPSVETDALARGVQAALSPTPVSIDALARLLDAPIAAIEAALTALELAGAAETLPGGYAASSSRP